MCGIVGQIRKDKKVDTSLFNKMRDTLFHRGPDGAGTELLHEDTVALGHRRLAIIDLSRDGLQPMSNSEKSIWVTYNGEIYNFKKLREQLQLRGYNFRSRTDTEVLIHGYQEWGIEGLLMRIKGMFAFAIWDANKRKLFGARDRFGIKPFYYAQENHKFTFASEIKAIIRDPSVEKIVDPCSLADFFLYFRVSHVAALIGPLK